MPNIFNGSFPCGKHWQSVVKSDLIRAKCHSTQYPVMANGNRLSRQFHIHIIKLRSIYHCLGLQYLKS